MRTMRAMPEKTTAHSRAYWNLTPTRVAVVMVPGPMNALVIIAAGPIFFSFCIKVFFSIRVYLLSELQITFWLSACWHRTCAPHARSMPACTLADLNGRTYLVWLRLNFQGDYTNLIRH